MWTCQSHILSKMSWASTFTSSCVGGHVNLISLVVGEHAKSHLFIMWVCASLLFYIKQGPKTSQNRSFEGVLGALGGLLEPSWPMWAPRANITSKKVVRWPPLPPPLGAILEPKLGLCWSMLVKNVFHDTLGKHVVSKHHFFNETWSPRAPLGPQKSSKTMGGLQKMRFSAFH